MVDPERTGEMASTSMQKLVEQARKDPKFLHALVFDPESVLPQLDYLDRGQKSALLGNSPEDTIGSLVGQRTAVAAAQDFAP